ncbi:glycosyltransferase family protein [Mucilaginibacter pedocola]|uniref:Spore protein YkvP/CgeB glycosyl transferase-like domain-containing protein n=1 Tax=Mucilaginibacter pedocola TaxID=1792845 RepID=A0A1S9PAS4_9SPHI|nr:hypothetical protein [Mucilaginibacter pedocola]OOQ58083.1 hypothetical protein BC343_10520 [Mucilaginibacter pedocola]
MDTAKSIICIITQSHLCRNPRVLKEAVTLAQNGYAVHVLTSIYSATLLHEDQKAISDTGVQLHIIADNSARNFRSFINRATNKVAKLLVKYELLQTPYALGYRYGQYLKKSKELVAALYICHQEMPTCVGMALLKQGYKVAFDLEDWYSEDLLPEAQQGRPIELLEQAEAMALSKGAYTITTSHALADILYNRYGGNIASVIYNVFPSPKLKAAEPNTAPPLRLLWFSQTIGPGRGLEEFISLLTDIKTGVEIHLLGAIDAAYKTQLLVLVAPQHSVHFHPLVPEGSLMDRIAEFDIGLALENTHPLSRNYTITNKFFQYIQTGLPVIATETAGQAEAFEVFNPGIMLRKNDKVQSIKLLESWLSDPSALVQSAERAHEAAKYYNWETESVKLLKLVSDAIGK